MPFKSEAQRRWMYANKPEMAEEWEKETPKGRKLPKKLKKKGKAKTAGPCLKAYKGRLKTKKQIHQLADRLNIPWDDDPKFKRWSKKITGKTCLDAMTVKQLDKVKRALKVRGEKKKLAHKLSERSFYIKWKHALPRKTAKRYVDVFGPPDETGRDFAKWDNIANFGGPTVIKDEEISHTKPVKHIDFVYSTRPIRVPARKVGVLAKSSGSISVDQLKGEVTARCHYLIKNAVTLKFVEDVVSGKIPDNKARAEYARRIKNNIYPGWFKDPLGEYKKTLAVDVSHHLEINK